MARVWCKRSTDINCLKRFLKDPDPTVSVPNINVPKYQPKKKLTQTPPISHPYGTHLKTKSAATSTYTSLISMVTWLVVIHIISQWFCKSSHATIYRFQSVFKHCTPSVICSSLLQDCCREVHVYGVARLSTQGLMSWGNYWFCAGHVTKVELPDFVMPCLQEECVDMVGGGYTSNVMC